MGEKRKEKLSYFVYGVSFDVSASVMLPALKFDAVVLFACLFVCFCFVVLLRPPVCVCKFCVYACACLGKYIGILVHEFVRCL